MTIFPCFQRKPRRRTAWPFLRRLCLFPALVLGLGTLVFAQGPQWWTNGVLTNMAVTNDYAPANAGQLKNLAWHAYQEMQATFPGGAAAAVSNLVFSLASGGDFSPVNVGQLKYVAQPFYSNLIAIGYTSAYPWAGSPTPNDFAPANIGQLKNVFGFDLTDTDGDGLFDGVEVQQGTDPAAYDTDHDGWRDGLDPEPKSRAWVDWGNSNEWLGSTLQITNRYWPAWCKEAKISVGTNDYAASSFNVASNAPLYQGIAYIVVDTNLVQGTDMALWTRVSTSQVGQLYFQLRNMAWTNLIDSFLGSPYNPQYPAVINTATLAPSNGEILLKVPMSNLPSAANIICHRYTNAIAIYDSMLFMDSNGDFLDDTQMAAITANPTNDYDADGLADFWEFTHGFDFTRSDQNGNGIIDGLDDSDGDGLSDGDEVNRGTDPFDTDTDEDGLLDGHDIAVDEEDSRYELWAAAGILYVDDNGIRTFKGEIDAGTDPLDSDTDDDGIPDGEDPYPTQPNQEPMVRFRHPLDGQQFSGPAQIVLASDWLYGAETPSQVVYQIVCELDGTTNEIQIAASGDQSTNWYAPPGDFHVLVHGVDATGQTGETRRVDIVVVESDSFSALSAAQKLAVLEDGPRAVEGVEEWTYRYSCNMRTGNVSGAESESGSRTVAGFVNATNFTVIPVSNSNLSVAYHDRDLMYAHVVFNPTTNLIATLYGVRRWGARVEAELPPPPVAPRSWPGPAAYDTMLVFDQNECGEWVGKVYPNLYNLAANDPFALLHLAYGAERDAYLYRNGTYYTLIAPTNFNDEYDYRLVFGLNNEGQMVGAGLDYDAHGEGIYLGWDEFKPIVYRSGQTGTVLSVSTQAVGGAAYAVNDKGVIVGCEISTNEVPRAVKWVGGTVEALGGLTGATESVAFDISEDGAIAGMKKVNGQWLPFLVDESGTSTLSSSTFAGIDFKEFWHVGKFGALGWGGSNSAQRLYWVIPDDDQDGFSDIIEQEIVDADPADGLTNIADVASSGDYDGDGLTNLQEWELTTDPLLKDSDGDRIPDWENDDPLPLTNRDTDGDELPDDWETYYGLNPGSAAGANGASGDPDGDGLVNLREFQLGTIPTGPNGPSYRFHREKMGQLMVNIVDSENCPNGTQSSRQAIERRIQLVEILDTNLPPAEFTFKVSVTGRVERQDAGYDQVRVNDKLAFFGTGEGLGCEMAGKSAAVFVPVQVPPGELVLSYDTMDGLFHVGAFAQVTGIELANAETNTPRLDIVETEVYGCAGCSNGCDVTLHLTNSYPAGGAAQWYGGPSNALLGVGDSVTIDYSTWPPSRYAITASPTGYVSYADVCVLYVLKVESVELVSGATADHVTPPHTWATVKNTNSPTEYVLVRAEIEPDIDPASLPAGFISWSGGEAVATNQLQRKVPKNLSAHTELVASCGGLSATGHVWVIWAAVQNLTSDTTPANAVQYGTRYDGTEILGARYYNSSNSAVGKVVPVGTITPVGIHDVVASGWGFEREKCRHDFHDGVQDPSRYDSSWQPDTSDPSFQNLTPDSDDKIYDRDAPNIADFGVVDSYERYDNFREWIEWSGIRCSDYAGWYWQARWKKDQTPQVTHATVGTGEISPLPTTAFYPVP